VNLRIWKEKKRKGVMMKNGLALVLVSLTWASAAMAHPGAHVHPHDGAHWLALVSALGLIAVAGGLAFGKIRKRK
jgi:uncharacterized PurR-regulated membrane protein YhhQ (DUF165 family)